MDDVQDQVWPGRGPSSWLLGAEVATPGGGSSSCDPPSAPPTDQSCSECLWLTGLTAHHLGLHMLFAFPLVSNRHWTLCSQFPWYFQFVGSLFTLHNGVMSACVDMINIVICDAVRASLCCVWLGTDSLQASQARHHSLVPTRHANPGLTLPVGRTLPGSDWSTGPDTGL